LLKVSSNLGWREYLTHRKMDEKHFKIALCFIFLVYIEPFKLYSKTKCRYYVKLLMESCHTLFMEKLVIGLSHFWSAQMVCVGWIQDTFHCLMG
jgi:hypothetical protein